METKAKIGALIALAAALPNIEAPKLRINRSCADSLSGRRMTSAKGSMFVSQHGSQLSPEQRNWNEEIERKKQEKKAAKQAI